MSDSEKLDLILTGVLDLNTRMYRVEEDLFPRKGFTRTSL